MPGGERCKGLDLGSGSLGCIVGKGIGDVIRSDLIWNHDIEERVLS
jgi:hypothetical protein